MKTLVLSLILVFSMNNWAMAQVTINQSQDVIDLIDKDKAVRKSKKYISGWSVQLLASNERSKVTELKGVFLNTYPDIKVDWDYDSPYYKLQAGAFRTKREASRLLERIKPQFPDAYIVTNRKISPIDLL